MNTARRRAISELIDQIHSLKSEFEALISEEQDYLEIMPESFQQGEKGNRVEEIIQSMEDAETELENAIGSMEQAIEN